MLMPVAIRLACFFLQSQDGKIYPVPIIPQRKRRSCGGPLVFLNGFHFVFSSQWRSSPVPRNGQTGDWNPNDTHPSRRCLDVLRLRIYVDPFARCHRVRRCRVPKHPVEILWQAGHATRPGYSGSWLYLPTLFNSEFTARDLLHDKICYTSLHRKVVRVKSPTCARCAPNSPQGSSGIAW